MIQDGLGGHRSGNRCHPAADIDQVAQDVPLHAEIEGDDVRPAGCGCFRCPRGMAVGTRAVLIEKKLLVQAGFPGEGFPGHDLAGEVAADQPGALPSLGHQAGVVEIGRRQDALHRPPDPRQPHQGAGVDPLDADDAVSGQKRFERFLRAEVADPAAQLANHEAADPGATALQILVVDPVIADLGVGHRHDLTVIGGVGQDLLITGHARVEDDLAIDLAPGAKGPAGEDRTVLEREFRRVHRHYRGRSAATPEPGCLIQTTQSYPVRCSCVESRPRGRPGPFRFRSGIGSVS